MAPDVRLRGWDEYDSRDMHMYETQLFRDVDDAEL